MGFRWYHIQKERQIVCGLKYLVFDYKLVYYISNAVGGVIVTIIVRFKVYFTKE